MSPARSPGPYRGHMEPQFSPAPARPQAPMPCLLLLPRRLDKPGTDSCSASSSVQSSPVPVSPNDRWAGKARQVTGPSHGAWRVTNAWKVLTRITRVPVAPGPADGGTSKEAVWGSRGSFPLHAGKRSSERGGGSGSQPTRGRRGCRNQRGPRQRKGPEVRTPGLTASPPKSVMGAPTPRLPRPRQSGDQVLLK